MVVVCVCTLLFSYLDIQDSLSILFIYSPVVSVMGDNVFRVLVKLNLCRKAVTYDVGAPSAIKISLPGTTPIDAERRKSVYAFTSIHICLFGVML